MVSITFHLKTGIEHNKRNKSCRVEQQKPGSTFDILQASIENDLLTER